MRYLALDLGNHIGVAVGESASRLARPLCIFRRTSRAADLVRVRDLVRQQQATALVIGLPLNMDGSEGTAAQWARDYGVALGTGLELPVIFWDERLSSVEAQALIQESGRRRPARDDAIAAAIILQSFLDAQTNTGLE